MTQISRPWTSTTPGDAGPYSQDNWAQLERYVIGDDGSNGDSGPITGSGVAPDPGLTVTQRGAGANMSVDVSVGAALVNGTFYYNDAVVNLVIAANASGNPRIDTIVLNKDWSAQTIRLLVVQGTPAGSPVPPSLTQTALTQWQIPLHDVTVANGAVSITNANIVPHRSPANIADGIYLHGVLNNSGVVLQNGDVVIRDSTADRAVTTTTTANDKRVLGVVVGRIPIGGYGRIQTHGIGYVNSNAATTRGQAMVTTTSAKQGGPAATAADTGDLAQFAVALQTTAGSGLVLCLLGSPKLNTPIVIKADPTELTDSNSAGETTIYTTTIPGGTLGINDSIVFELWLSLLNNSGAGRVLTARVKYGGTTVLTIAPTLPASATVFSGQLRAEIKNAGATNSQKGVGYFTEWSGTASAMQGSTGTAAVNSLIDQTLAITIQSDANTATQTYTQQQAYVDYKRNT